MAQEIKSIGLVILGAGGYMGKNVVDIVPTLRTALAAREVNLSLVCVAEIDEEKRASIARHIAATVGLPCRVLVRGTEAIGFAVRWLNNIPSKQRVVLIYDATPAGFHYAHLTSVLPLSLFAPVSYFGEKPLFTTLDQVDFVESTFGDADFFSEFIETENPSFKAAKAVIDSEGLEIQRMWLWRASCTGASIAAGDGRPGVEGGALLDKAPHDLSISVGLLGHAIIKDWTIRQAQINLVALHQDSFEHNQKSFLSLINRPLSVIRPSERFAANLPADALCSFEVDWLLSSGRVVPATYVASWVGCQNTANERVISERLATLGLDKGEWLDTEAEKTSSNTKYHYRIEEARIGVLECLLKGRTVHLVINFLSKYKTVRFVHLVYEDMRRTVIPLEDRPATYEEKKHKDLASVFGRVMEHCVGVGRADNTGSRASLLVHKVMLSARAQANVNLRNIDQDSTYEDSVRAYRQYLVKRVST